MAPPSKRSQQAADALLNGASIASKSLAQHAVAASAKAKKKNDLHNNPHSRQQQLHRRPTTGGMSAVGVAGRSLAGGNTKAAGTKPRPLANVRGKNGSSTAIFDRRNGHDRISKKVAPRTDTDLNLLAMLDDGQKKKRKTPTRGQGRGTEKRPKKVTSNNYNDDMVMMAPPPMASYSSIGSSRSGVVKSSVNKPRKRVSSHSQVHSKKDWRTDSGKAKVREEAQKAKESYKRYNGGGQAGGNREDNTRNKNVSLTTDDTSNDSGTSLTDASVSKSMVDASNNGMVGRVSGSGEQTERRDSSFAEITTASSASVTSASLSLVSTMNNVSNDIMTHSVINDGERSSVQNPYKRKATTKSDDKRSADIDIEMGEGLDKIDASNTASKHISDVRTTSADIIPSKSCSLGTTSSAAAVRTKSKEAKNKEAILPTKGEESMVPLSLGIGAKKRGISKSKPSRVGSFGSTNKGRSRRKGDDAMNLTKDMAEEQPSEPGVQTSIGNEYHTSNDNEPAGGLRATYNANNAADNGIDDKDKPTNYAEWYDPDEFAEMTKEVEANIANDDATNLEASGNSYNKKGRNKNKSNANVNENFVRLDLKNSAGSCRGARNLKKVNKQKLWRAQHRFGMSDRDANNDNQNGDNGGMGGMGQQQRSRYGKRNNKADKGGDLKCFASAKSGGVDPLDDFMDGKFTTKPTDEEDGKDDGTAASTTAGTAKSASDGKTTKKSAPPKRGDDGVPICTRHNRPCKLLTVKRNTKGNKGRKFYVCSMPRGEQCDFFKWEEDTVEATQRALLKSSSNTGFIARQVAAAKIRFKELTVPELRVEAKKRGLKGTGKKDQILTRLLIWVRDEIANSVDDDGEPKNDDTKTTNNGDDPNDEDSKTDDADGIDNDDNDSTKDGDESCLGSDPGEGCEDSKTETGEDNKSKMIDLDDDDDGSSYDCDSSADDDEFDDGEVEVCAKPATAPKARKSKSNTLEDSLEKYFGYTTFRSGQEWAIRRTLSHQKTLLVAPTGQGKSLCYALPAALMDGICLVVSPLISLMQDQLRQLPPKIPAATLSGSITTAQMALIVDDIMRGRYKVLFVSPERLASAAFRRLVRPKFNVVTREYERQFPTVSLLCVDEAHCLSQWGHNFRPSYLRLRSLLPLIEPKSILALTATAGPLVVRDICNTLCIPYDGHTTEDHPTSPEAPIEVLNNDADMNMDSDGGGVKVLNCDRDNIDVFSLVLQNNDERRYLLHKILKDKQSNKSDNSRAKKKRKLPIEEGCLSKGNVIVYVWRQKDTEIVAEQLNGAGIRGGVVCYHGGMDSNARSRAQSKFMRGKARICVATVAFGLGINKPDIEGVIHLCLPPSPEHYLQEIGRAGRDGRPAKAIALPLEDEFVSRHSLAHSDRSSENQLGIVFRSLQNLVNDALADIPPDAGVDLEADELFIDDIHVAMPVKLTVDASDCKEESIETICSLLEGETPSDQSLLSVQGYLPDAASITLKKRSLDKLEKFEQLARSILKCGTRVDGEGEQSNQDTSNNSFNKYQGNGGTAMQKGFYAYSFGTYKFSIVRCAHCMGPNTEPRHVYAALRRLQGNGELELELDTTANGRAMHLKMKRDGIHLFRKKGGNYSSSQEGEASVSDDVGAVITKLSKQFSAKEKVGVGKVESMYEIMHQVSCTQSEDNEDKISGEEDEDDAASCQEKKSPRLVIFQKMVQNYFSNLPPTQDPANKAPVVIKEFPLGNRRLLSCLCSDVSLLMQMLALRPQEQIPSAVRVNEPQFADYRDLCIAKIFHSIDAPRAPILSWYNHILWGKYRSYSFSSVVQAVKKTFDNA